MPRAKKTAQTEETAAVKAKKNEQAADAAEAKPASKEFKYEVVEKIGVLSEGSRGWQKEFRRISWNGGKPKYDVRDWAPDDAKMGKGVTLTSEEIAILKELLEKIDI